jgi:indole-3-glycerol phosphate synthase
VSGGRDQDRGAGREPFADVVRELFTASFPDASEDWIAREVASVVTSAAARGTGVVAADPTPWTLPGGGVLDDILAGVRDDLVDRQARVPLEALRALAQAQPPAKPAEAVLRDGVTVKVIAEVKRASPSRGAIAAIADPAGLAAAYEAGGATWISVLTERRHFGGHLDDLAAVRRATDVPVLRKDFVLTGYQVWEARAYGADAVLLVVAALEHEALVSLVERVESLGMTPFVEVNNEVEVRRALDAGARVVAVNARNLRTLEVDRDTFVRLAPLLPAGVVRVAASGIRGPHDVFTYADQGAHAVLVGESLAASSDPRAAVADLVTHPALATARPA